MVLLNRIDNENPRREVQKETNAESIVCRKLSYTLEKEGISLYTSMTTFHLRFGKASK